MEFSNQFMQYKYPPKNENILKNCYNFFNSWLIIIKLHMYVLYLFAINMNYKWTMLCS